MNNKKALATFEFLLLLVLVAEAVSPSVNSKCARRLNCSLTADTQMTCNSIQATSVAKCAEKLEALVLRSGIIQRLDNSAFPATLSTLKTLVVSNVSLKLLNKTTFENLSELCALDLSVNFIRSVDPELLINNVLLEHLNFSSNMIKRMVANQFVLPYLKKLDLSNCLLEIIEETAFANVTSLLFLNLRSNKLKTLSFQLNASVILLSFNPWNCDCYVYLSIKKYVTDECIESSSCWDVERSLWKPWNETNLSDAFCEEEIRQNFNWSRRERNLRDDNNPDVIITIYGYVFVGLSALVCMCCCCDKRKTRIIANPP